MVCNIHSFGDSSIRIQKHFSEIPDEHFRGNQPSEASAGVERADCPEKRLKPSLERRITREHAEDFQRR